MKVLINRAVWLCLLVGLMAGCKKKSTGPTQPTETEIPDGGLSCQKGSEAPVINGTGDEACWQNAVWASIDHLWLGQQASASDFTGRYKIVWTEEKLYFLVEITDEKITDTQCKPARGLLQRRLPRNFYG